ncbi:MAG: isochorismatase family protein [Gammaproteobacteria bacterium]|nr:isochorismatase family protein [Gammaproteobacteria bacterium]MBI5617312.1 isochorismatase family protein [Gammaproteobacteria bacterium]
MANTENYKCDAAQSQLVIVDIQQRLGDAMPGKVLNRVIENTCLVAKSAGLLGVPALHTQQYPQGLGPTHPTVAAALSSTTRNFEKTSFSCCGAEGFAAALAGSGRRQVILVGMEAHICVLQTALDLKSAGYEVFVVEDAICSRRLENYQNALDRMRRCGVNIASAESVVFEWLGSSRHESFKAIQAMLR